MDVADGYVTFVRHSQDMLREKVNEEVYIERLFDVSKLIVTWLLQGFIHSTSSFDVVGKKTNPTTSTIYWCWFCKYYNGD